MKKILILLLVVAISPMMIFANGEKESSAESEKDVVQVAQVAWGLDDIFFQTVQDGLKYQMEMLADEHGYIYKRTLDGSNSPEDQVNLLETMLVHEPDFGVFCTVDSNLVGPIKEYNDQNIPFITNNMAVYGGKQTLVAFDNREAGRECARNLISIFEKKFGKEPATWGAQYGGGVIVELTGDLASAGAQDRSAGFHDILDPIVEKTPSLLLITQEGKWSADLAYTRMSDMITKYGSKIIGTYTHGDTMTIAGVWPALKENGMAYTVDNSKHVAMVCIDGTSAALQMIRDNNLDSVTIQPAWGEGVVVARLMDSIHEKGYENGIAKVGTTLWDDEMIPLIMKIAPDQFTEEELKAGAKPVWAPVEVCAGEVPNGSWDGVWYKTNSTASCPDDFPADSKLLWGNFWDYIQNGKWAWE